MHFYRKIITSLILISVLFISSADSIAQAAGEPDYLGVVIYVVPPITDDKILPDSSISNGYISEEISLAACPGEYEPASFVVRAADEDITSLIVEASDLVGSTDLIPKENVDIRIVKCWYQAGERINEPFFNPNAKVLTPELLLKDDSLVNVVGQDNYLKVSGGYTLISNRDGIQGISDEPTSDEFPVQDSPTLLPVNIPQGTNKQFWVTVKVPNDASSGAYIGQIQLNTSVGTIGEVQITLEVLPIALAQPYLIYSIYYVSQYDAVVPLGSISPYHKNETQMRAEIRNMVEHGVANPAIYSPFGNRTALGLELSLMNEIGITNCPLYYAGLGPWGYQPVNQVQEAITFARSYGFTDVYFYGIDEALGAGGGTPEENVALLTDQRTSWEAIRSAGGKIFATGARQGFFSDARSPGEFGFMGDILDLFICYGSPTKDEADRWHSLGHQVLCYANPQVGEEKPETYRRNFGLLLWQRDYDGAMDFAYQYNYGNIWNDFDHFAYRDHVFAYPTINGVIDTIQWEGWREGVDDIRYLTTFLDLIEEAKINGIDTSSAEAWLAELKNSDLSNANLDTIRLEIIEYILSLSGYSPVNHPPVLNTIGNKSISVGELLRLNITATDLEGDTLTYSVSNLPEGTSFDSQTLVFSWTPGDNQVGVYSDIHFEVFDGNLTDSEDIDITVSNVQPITNSSGGGGAPPIPGFTSLPPGIIRADGILNFPVVAMSEDKNIKIQLDRGTECLTERGLTPAVIYILPIAEIYEPQQPVDAFVIGAMYAFGPDGATFDPPGTLTVIYDESPLMPEGINEEDLVIAYYDEEIEEWIPLADCVVDPEENTVTCPISHFTPFAVLAYEAAPLPLVPATFELSPLVITPVEVEIGEEIVISVTVTNTGEQSGNHEIALMINGELVDTREIIGLTGGTEQIITFTTAGDTDGTYTVDMNGKTGTFVVKEPPAPMINNFSVTPSYYNETHNLAFARVIYEVNTFDEMLLDAEMVLKVSLNSEALQQFSLLPVSRLTADGIGGRLDYTPPQGWQSGTYTFRVELYLGERLYVTTDDEILKISAPTVAPEYSWAILGEIILAAIICSAMTTVAILVYRRRLLRHLVKR